MNKAGDRKEGVRFVNQDFFHHWYDSKTNWTPLSPITIIKSLLVV